jgi:hypothetical protein
MKLFTNLNTIIQRGKLYVKLLRKLSDQFINFRLRPLDGIQVLLAFGVFYKLI